MALVLAVFVALLVLNVPIAFVVGLAGASYFVFSGSLPFSVAVQRVVAQTQSYSFLAVPFFIFAGSLMNESGITKYLLKLAKMITRRMWGGLAQINILLSTMMGGISGSVCADAAMEARVLGFDMIKRGYSKGYTVAVTCLSALVTATIPPSVGLILFGYVGGVSIGRLFMAGIVPGVLMATLLTVGVMTPPVGTACYIVCGILDCPVEEYVKESIPFFCAVLLVFAILIFFPDIVLFLPNLAYGT